MNIVAGILIGGLSRRMGRPKALIEIGGRSLLDRTVAVARELCDRVLLLGSPPFDLPPMASHLDLIHDQPPDIGPMGGLNALLDSAAPDPALLLACDLPRLDANLLHRLADNVDCESDAAIFSTNAETDHLEPCCGIYMPSARSALKSQIASNDYSLQRLLSRLRVRSIPLLSVEASLLANMNDPADVPNNNPQ